MAKRSQQIGKGGEKTARGVLAGRGVMLPEKIGTPVRLVPYPGPPNVYKVYWGEKVYGDIMGILPNGIRVLAETKTILEGNLVWSKLRAHQPERLDLNKKYHGVSLLVWVHHSGVYVLDWIYPNEDFKPRKGLTPERAAELNIMDVRKLSKVRS